MTVMYMEVDMANYKKFDEYNKGQTTKRAKIPEEEFFRKINIGEFIDKERQFRNQTFSKMSEDEIRESLRRTLTNNGDLSIIFNGAYFAKDTFFYRIREYRDDDPTLKIESGFWNPPKDYVKKWGRFNRPEISMLYTSAQNPGIAFEEMKHITEDKKFVLIAYKANKQISTFSFGSIKYNHFTSENAISAAKLYQEFLLTELTRDVQDGQEYLYKISTIIAELFSIQPTINALVYPCVARKDIHNTCFSGENVKSLLEFQWAIPMVKLGSYYNSNCIVESFSEIGEAIYRDKVIMIPKDYYEKYLPSSIK